MPVSLLAIAAHRDDVELTCAGTLIKTADAGHATGILDLTAGEMGTRGSAELRAEEAARAAQVMGVAERRNAGLPDARIANNDETRRIVVEQIRHFAPRVKGFLMKSGADATLAEECAQDVMATLWHKAHLFDPARGSVATWVFTIARNRKIDLLRKQRRPEPEDLPWGPEAEPAQDDALALQQESENLRRALAELPDAQRELIERAYFGDLSHSEIAAETGLPLGTIKSRIRLALERLRHAMR